MSSDSPSPPRQHPQPLPRSSFSKEEELAVIQAGNYAKSTIYTIAECCSSDATLGSMLKRNRDFREAFLRICAQFQLQHPEWPKRTEQTLIYKYNQLSGKIGNDCGNVGSGTLARLSKAPKKCSSCMLMPKILEVTTKRMLNLLRQTRIEIIDEGRTPRAHTSAAASLRLFV